MNVMEQWMGESWALWNGDSAAVLKGLPESSVDLSVFSPPFSSLFCYSPLTEDLGNSRDDEEFFQHYGFISRELLRVTRPGRHICVHVMDLPTTKATHGVIELRDFSGMVVRHHQEEGWHYHGRVTCNTNPQAPADLPGQPEPAQQLHAAAGEQAQSRMSLRAGSAPKRRAAGCRSNPARPGP